MSGAAKIFWTAVIVVLAGGAVASQYILVRGTGFERDTYTTNAGELTSETLVGQTFTAERDNLAGVSVMFATYSGRANTEPIEFYLRSSVHSSDNIRTARIDPRKLGDNQLYPIIFDPIPDSAGKQYFFFLVSPTSSPGNAVTIDLDSRDPYHLGTAFLVRGDGPDITNPVILDRSGKQTVDVSFGLQYQIPLRVALLNRLNALVHTIIDGWRTQKDIYLAYGWSALAAGLFLVVIAAVQQRVYLQTTHRMSKHRFTVGMLLVLMAAGLLLRLQYATELPITNDEGNYLYDAVSLRRGLLAGGDGYVKAPLVIAWVAGWQQVFGDTVLAGRLASIVAGVLTTIPIYLFAKSLWTSRAITSWWLTTDQQFISSTGSRRWGRRVGLVAAALWTLAGSSVVSDIYVHTQPLALFFAVSGLALLMAALRGETPVIRFRAKRTIPSAIPWFIAAGCLLGLGVASRKSVLALGLVPVLLIFLEGKNWRHWVRHFASFGGGFAIIITLFLGGAFYLYGSQGVAEAIGYNSAEDGITAVTADEVEQVREYSIRGMTPFFRENLLLLLLVPLGLGFSLEYAMRTLLDRIPDISHRKLFARLGWVFAWMVFIWSWRFFFEYEGAPFMRYGIEELWWFLGAVLAVATFWPDVLYKSRPISRKEVLVPTTKQPGFHGKERTIVPDKADESSYLVRHLAAALLVPLWVGGLVFFYVNWIKFHANYISEFIPPLVILGSYGAVALFRRLSFPEIWRKNHPWMDILRRGFIGASVLIIGFAFTTSNFITYFFEHTGTFTQGSVKQAAQWAQQHIPEEEPIFTGAGIVPYLSGHRTALDIAHPRWYAYEFTRKDEDRLGTFLPPISKMLTAYREANWFLLERQTGFSFLMEYTEIEAGLEKDWEKIYEVENGGNTLIFYRRIQG